MNRQLELFDTKIYERNGEEYYAIKKSWHTVIEYACYSLAFIFGLTVVAFMLTIFSRMIF